MPPVISTTNADSESEDDDYVPPADEQDSESDAEKSLEGSHTATLTTVEDPEEKKRKRDALWAEFQTSVTNVKPPEYAIPPKTVKIEKRYRFAGDEVERFRAFREVVEVVEDSSEAKKWSLWKKDPNATGVDASSPEASGSTEFIEKQSAEPTLGRDDTLNLTDPTNSPSVSSKPVGGKRPGPRKPKTTLGPLPGPSTKPKKLTTLDKSAMDWRAHIQAEQESGSSLKDELEANRRAGGYLEKMEFLRRVEIREEENLDVVKSSKRRKI